MGGRRGAQVLEPSYAVFPGTLAGSWLRSGAAQLELVSIWNPSLHALV